MIPAIAGQARPSQLEVYIQRAIELTRNETGEAQAFCPTSYMLSGIFLKKLVVARQYSTMPASTMAAAKDFLSFVNASPTPFHAVKCVKDRLAKAGFQEIKVRRLTV